MSYNGMDTNSRTSPSTSHAFVNESSNAMQASQPHSDSRSQALLHLHPSTHDYNLPVESNVLPVVTSRPILSWLASWLAPFRLDYLLVRTAKICATTASNEATALKWHSTNKQPFELAAICTSDHFTYNQCQAVHTFSKDNSSFETRRLFHNFVPSTETELFLRIGHDSLVESVCIQPNSCQGENRGESNQSKNSAPLEWYANERVDHSLSPPSCLRHYQLNEPNGAQTIPDSQIESQLSSDTEKQHLSAFTSTSLPNTGRISATWPMPYDHDQVPKHAVSQINAINYLGAQYSTPSPLNLPLEMSNLANSSNRPQSSRIRFQTSQQERESSFLGQNSLLPSSSSHLSASLPSLEPKRFIAQSPTLAKHPLHYTIDISKSRQTSSSNIHLSQGKTHCEEQSQNAATFVSTCSQVTSSSRSRFWQAFTSGKKKSATTSEARPFLLVNCVNRQRSAYDARLRKYQFVVNHFLERPRGRVAILYHLSL